MKIGVVIPALNEAETIITVVRECRRAVARMGPCRIVVSDNGSSDATAERARSAGAEVVLASRRGYGAACKEGIQHLNSWPDVVVFVDGDGSCFPGEMTRLLTPIQLESADLVLGRRSEEASLGFLQRWGTRLAVRLLAWRWGTSFADLGPYRAVRRTQLERLPLQDETWGWTLEMQILAVLAGLRIEEVPVQWGRRRGGRSKISGSLTGSLRAGCRILWTLVHYGLRSRRLSRKLRPA